MLAVASLLVALSVQHGNGTEACLDSEHLARGVERRLKRQVFVDAARADLRFAVSFERHGAQTEARIDVADRDGRSRGSRSLVTSSHCSALDDSLALSVALLVDQPPEAPVSPSERAVAKPTITIPPEVAAPREPWHGGFGAALIGSWGVLPRAGSALALSFELAPRPPYAIRVDGELFGSAEAQRDATSGARLRLWRIGVSFCPRPWEVSVGTLGFCFGQKLGSLRIEGYGFDHDAAERRLTLAFVLGLESRLRLSRHFWLRGDLGAEAPLLRDRIASSGRRAAELFRPAPVAFASEIGIEAAIW